jgi:hypothetical protein
LAIEIVTAAPAAVLDGVDAELLGLDATLVAGNVGAGVDAVFLLLEQAVSASAPAAPTSTSCLIIVVLLAVRHGLEHGSVQPDASA